MDRGGGAGECSGAGGGGGPPSRSPLETDSKMLPYRCYASHTIPVVTVDLFASRIQAHMYSQSKKFSAGYLSNKPFLVLLYGIGKVIMTLWHSDSVIYV